ncbi:MAG: signal recognition particle protein [Oscillospiraceae bacterium]|nr:signal recognition particle protein [Oscillospiraceae bacterium]MBR5071194.1 signal recognition particle protein [Oscillospiraceae bacterium]MBR5979376.1 signal recognition particle protein [Oscillospiraceae bacterium]
MAFESLTSRLGGVFSGLRKKGKLNEKDIASAMREVRMALLEADVNYKVAKQFTDQISEKALGEEVMKSLTPAQQVVKIVNDELVELMGKGAGQLRLEGTPPTVILMCGLQGGGKTTHCAKLAKMYRDQGHRPLLVACDVYRPAAIEQLKIMGEKAGVPVFEMGQGDPHEIARRGVMEAKDHGYDIVLIDTAGRLQIDEELMDELERLKKDFANRTILVVDSLTGQEAVNVADTFNKRIGIDGVILTKLDADSRGGAALSVLSVTGKPILFAGTGEKVEDLEVFHPDRMASRILGMGDVMSLIEKATSSFDEKAAEELFKKTRSKKGMDLNDLLDQLRQLNNMGNIRQLIAMMPGGANIPDEAIDEKAFTRTEAIILSMTPEERRRPDILNASRKRRIAAGCGMKVEDINRLLKQYEQSNKMMKQMTKLSKRGRNPLKGFPFS